MPDTFIKIASVTVGAGGAATIDFSSIPSTYTDLSLQLSLRDNRAQDFNDFILKPNGSTSGFTSRAVIGNGTSASSASYTTGLAGVEDSATATASTFANISIYIPNYAGSNQKSASIDSVSEKNATYAEAWLIAYLWANTAAITSLSLVPSASASFVQYSTATLYGIKNS